MEATKDVVKVEFFAGDVPKQNQEAREILKDWENNPGSPDEEIQVVELGTSDCGRPTILYGHIPYKGINEIEKFCTFMKKSHEERNGIVSANLSDGIIGF